MLQNLIHVNDTSRDIVFSYFFYINRLMCLNDAQLIFNNPNNLFQNGNLFYKKYKLLSSGYNTSNINLILKGKFMSLRYYMYLLRASQSI